MEPRPQSRTERRPSLPTDRTAPHSLDAERAVLSACLRDETAMGEAIGLLAADDFYHPRHRATFAAIMQLMQNGEPVEPVSVAVEMDRQGLLAEFGGPAFIEEILDVGSSPANLGYHAKVVAERGRLRRLIEVSHDVARDAYEGTTSADDLLDHAQNELFQLAQVAANRDYVVLKKLASDTFQTIQEAAQSKEEFTGVPTGFAQLDRMTGGMQRSDLVIIAGRPAMGKTSFALNLSFNAARTYKKPVGLFSLEMSSEQLCTRLISSQGRLDNHLLRTGKLKATDWPRLTQALNDLTHTEMYIDDTSSISLLELRSKARRMVQSHGCKMIVIDYMQLINAGTRIENRQQEISLISRSLKALAKDLEVPVIALSQLSRAVESRAGNRPMLSDLRESGAIEQDADIVMFVYRQEVYEPDNPDVRNLAEIIIGKHRNGSIGTIPLQFDRQFTKFSNLAADHPAHAMGEA
ncbi:replicative DNA helicase [bacterium]|nr:MAG: replicative DNA helicase [bacterium]RKZ13219.1 MAG: replicative DNA helicase [bacterium]